jgi:hypothetical protein
MAESSEDAKRIDEMNSSNSKLIKRQRMGIIQKQKVVKEENMPDSKQKMAIQATKQFSERAKGR